MDFYFSNLVNSSKNKRFFLNEMYFDKYFEILLYIDIFRQLIHLIKKILSLYQSLIE